MKAIMKLLSLLFLFGIFMASPSCSMEHLQAIVEEADTLVIDSIPPIVVDIGFPDTIYASAEKVMFVIDTIDVTLPCELSDFEDLYKDAPGIFMFRGSPSRNPNFCGRLHGDSVKISTEWIFTTSIDTTKTSHGVWGGGTGWTGQPLYVRWPDSLISRFRQMTDIVTDAFQPQEIMFASLCGKLYFVDFQTGKESRKPFETQNVLKGTPSLNPFLNGHLYVGHGVQKHMPFGTIVFDLFSHSEKHAFGKDPKAWRGWCAYDSSPVVVGGFVFRPGENGTVYKYYIGDGGYKLQSTLRYSLTKSKSSPGIESSMAVCKNYGYTADNAGNILCINLNTMKPVWHYFNHDDTDATPLVDVEDTIPYVYTGCEVDRQGNSGTSHFVKLNGLTGEVVWDNTVACKRIHFGDKSLDGGMFGSPLLGGGDCEGMIFSNFCVNEAKVTGWLLGFDKKDGHVVCRAETKHYCWSSPVALYNDNNEMFIFTADTEGYVYLIKAKTGEIVATEKIGSNFESSPIVVDDKIILGSRGNKIYKISLQ